MSDFYAAAERTNWGRTKETRLLLSRRRRSSLSALGSRRQLGHRRKEEDLCARGWANAEDGNGQTHGQKEGGREGGKGAIGGDKEIWAERETQTAMAKGKEREEDEAAFPAPRSLKISSGGK